MRALCALFVFCCFVSAQGGVLEVEVQGTTVNGYLCDATGRAAAESMVASAVLAKARSIVSEAYAVSQGSRCTGVSAPAAATAPPTTAPPTTAPPTTAPPTTAAPTTRCPTAAPVTAAPVGATLTGGLLGDTLGGITDVLGTLTGGLRNLDADSTIEGQHRRTGPVQIIAWATVGVPVSSSAQAASLSPAMFVPTAPGVQWSSNPGTATMLAQPNDPNCTYAITTGYTPVSCTGSLQAADCAVACDTGYSLPLTTPPTFLMKMCGPSGVFELSGCYPTGCKLGGESCSVASDCCRYSTPKLPLEDRQNACRAGSKSKVSKGKGKKAKTTSSASTCAPLSLPKAPKMNTRKKTKTIAAAVGAGVGASALGVAAVALRRRVRNQTGHKSNLAAPTTTSVPMTISV